MRSLFCAALAAALVGCGSSGKDAVPPEWRARGFVSVAEDDPVPLGGNYFVRVKVYKGPYDVTKVNKQDRFALLRLYYRKPGTSALVEVPFPAEYSVDKDISGRMVSPDGDRIMCVGTLVQVSPRPSLIHYVSAGRIGPDFEARLEGKPMTFHPHSVTPFWSPDGRRFAIEARRNTGDGSQLWNVFTWNFQPDKTKVYSADMALGPGSYHFGGWSPTGTHLAVFEGFPEERYSVGPKEVYHRFSDADFDKPISRPVKLWVLDMGKGARSLAATRVGGWLKPGPLDAGPGARPFHFLWSPDGSQLQIDELAKPGPTRGSQG
jgi:hypothetical protein